MLCCLAVGVALGNAAHFGLLAVPETLIRNYLVYSEPTLFRYAGNDVAIVLTLLICILTALPSFERPLLMVLSGAAAVITFVFAYMTILIATNYVLPAVAPMLAILICSGMLETMAWSDELNLRRELQSIDRARQQFIDMLVHDLRRRVSSVLNSTSVLEQTVNMQDESTGDALATMRTGAARIMMLVNNLLDVRKIEEGEMELSRESSHFDALLSAAVNEVHAAADIAGVTLTTRCEAGTTASVDRQIFGRVVSNLLWNAVQHAAAGSIVETQCLKVDNVLNLAVANRGPIIEPERRESLFRSFVSGRGDPHEPATDGTGLGLSFCRLAVEAHGGTINLESPWHPHADGVRVTVTVPAA